MTTGLIILIILTAVYLVILALYLMGRLGKDSIGLFGPIIMIKTGKGKGLIDRIASKRRFWRAYGTLSVFVVIAAMLLMFFVLLWQATVVSRIPANRAPSPQMMIGIPGVNPLIPVWYGILGLAVAMVFHEFAHGILTRVANARVKNLGLLYLIVPIGAFVEPDEEEVMALPRRKRCRLFAVGPATNIFIAIIVVIVFAWGFMASLEPEENGMLVLKVSKDLPADKAGIEPGMVIVAMNGTRINEPDDFFDFLSNTTEGQTINITVWDNGDVRTIENITLANRYNYTGLEEDKGKGYLGVSSPTTAKGLRDVLAHPYSGRGAIGIIGVSFLYISLPFYRLAPFPESIQNLYQVTGPLSVLPAPLFWILANSLYWIFWLNLMVGLTNALPAVPLDGGYIFRDMVDKVVHRFKSGLTKEEREKYVARITTTLAFFVLILILLPLIVPRLLVLI